MTLLLMVFLSIWAIVSIRAMGDAARELHDRRYRRIEEELRSEAAQAARALERPREPDGHSRI